MIEDAPGGARLIVRLTPRGGADGIDGIARDAEGRVFLKCRVRAVPEKGGANAALIALLAKALGAPARDIALTSGATARTKTIAVAGLSAEEVRCRLAIEDGMT